MSINLPNSFVVSATTAVFDEPEAVDFRSFAQHGLPVALVEQLQARRFLVTTARVTSQVSGEQSIDFVETLFKVPVRLNGRDFLFPVVTYVDHPYSLIRGYLLGFNKLFAPRTADPGILTAPGLEVDLRSRTDELTVAELLPPEQELPMLLWTDYSVGDARSHGLATLDVDAYERQGVRSLEARTTSQLIGGRNVTVRRLYEIRDTFVIRGTIPLA
ncbi:hypothetical protein OHV05_16390 [Kitasatospora sp. NBC_00070]|uniref:hypothetical protein n=1 Tax=Kitasatospora sp. NBC_00070 TaxID=2975962 RepID=UPI003256717A